MIRSGKEAAQLNNLGVYLKKLQLDESRNYSPNSDFEISEVRGLKYFEIWEKHIKRQWYDFRLDDNSLLFFHKTATEASFSYLGCPYDCMSYREFKEKEYRDEDDDEILTELYEEYIMTTKLKDNPNYMRYDYAENAYRPGEHPVSHLHCGLMDTVRIGLSRKLDFMAFVSLILRQLYCEKWNVVISYPETYQELFESKSKLEDIDSKFFQSLDKDQDYYLM